VRERAATRPEGSYVAALLDGGLRACAQKLGEEGVEAALAAAGESDERLVSELADLWFASYVVLAARGLDPAAVEEELARRAAAADAPPSAP
jgi:phosphoribosyl-ATP pyrophosphohydrolase